MSLSRDSRIAGRRPPFFSLYDEAKAINCIATDYAKLNPDSGDCLVRSTIAPYLELTTSDPNDLDDFVSDYNDFHADGDPNGNEAIWKESPSDEDPNEYATLAAWQSDTGQDAHSISAVPGFNDPNNDDYTLASSSPCIDRGSPSCPARLGYGGRMDMGMYEYDSRTGGTAASLAYDNAGNLTSDGDKEYYYDVLGRLTLAESGLNSNVKLAGYRYDALGRLAMQVTYDYTHDPNDPNAYYDESNATRYYYYDTPAGGDGASSPVLPQVVEIKDGSGDTTDQFVWGPAYVDELLLHERDADGDPNNVLEQRLCAAHDTLYSVLGLIDEDGNVVEQYSYSPYEEEKVRRRKGVRKIFLDCTLQSLADRRARKIHPDTFSDPFSDPVSVKPDEINLTLLRSPVVAHHDPALLTDYPHDAVTDQGRHEFDVTIQPDFIQDAAALQQMAEASQLQPVVWDLTG